MVIYLTRQRVIVLLKVIRDSDTTESILPGEHELDIPIGVSEVEDTSSRPTPTGSTAATAGVSSDVRIYHKATEKRRHCDVEDDLTETEGSAKRLYVGVQETIDLTTTDDAIGLGDASINNGVAYSKDYRPIVKTQSEDINRVDLWTDTQLETWDINGTDFDDISDWDILNAVEANESCEVHKRNVYMLGENISLSGRFPKLSKKHTSPSSVMYVANQCSPGWSELCVLIITEAGR
ncbi:uncharacterized protein LOC125294428 isoform X2 [Alosa alosa]|uniref:uncharacterized protein LOC125294428 isoform X2 n=1 Tax=Alosa alosa TaxID=278164 RepID=UPI0020153072|nr:uncharacterized protein LOC125294428 isoform X2 [Alosa alosa]